MASEDPAGMVRSNSEGCRRVGKRQVLETDLPRGHAGGGSGSRRKRAGALHGSAEPQHSGRGSRRAVECPRQAAERDHARGDSRSRIGHQPIERECSVDDRRRHRQEHDRVRREHDEQAPEDRSLSKSRRLPLQLEETTTARAETVDDP